MISELIKQVFGSRFDIQLVFMRFGNYKPQTNRTIVFVDVGTDSGPIILQKAVAVEPDDTPEVLQRRVMEQAEWIILPKAIDMIANGEI